MPPATPRLVIFDNDGVLVDSEPLACKALALTGQHYGIPVDTDWAYTTVGLHETQVAAKALVDFGRPFPPDWHDTYLQHVMTLFDTLQPLPHIFELLETLARQGIATAVATSSTRQKTEKKFAVTGLDAWFPPARILTGDDITHPKPAPEIYLKTAEREGISPQHCWVVEDSPTGVTAARAAGMYCLGFTGGSHYRHLHPSGLTAAGAAELVENHRQILQKITA